MFLLFKVELDDYRCITIELIFEFWKQDKKVQANATALEFTKLYYEFIDKKRNVSFPTFLASLLIYDVSTHSLLFYNSCFPNYTWKLQFWFGMEILLLEMRKFRNI